MNNRVPAFYPPISQEVKDYLRVVEEIVIPQCIEGETISILTPKISSALKPSYATMDEGKTFFNIYYSKEDAWEDAYYDVWHSSDKSDENLLIDLAIESIKSLEYWER